MKKLISLLMLCAMVLVPSCSFGQYGGGRVSAGASVTNLVQTLAGNESNAVPSVAAAKAELVTKTNAVIVGTLKLSNTTSTAYSIGYWTNAVTGVGTNGVYVRKVYTPAGTTNIYYSLYQ